jgi:hypothetical protein
MNNAAGADPAGGVDIGHLSRREVVIGATVAPMLLGMGLGDVSAQPTPPPGPSLSVPTLRIVNGNMHSLSLDPRSSLLDVLREQLGLTGCKKAATTVSAAPVPYIWMDAGSSPA